MTMSQVLALRVCAAAFGVALPAGCLFAPNIAQHGYTACTSDADCPAGRFCDEALCAPPPWNDTDFTHRQLVTVTNSDDAPLGAGTAVPVVISADPAPGEVALSDVPPDARFTRFVRPTRSWENVAVYRDVQDDRFTTWIPLAADLAPGASAPLAWIESHTASGVVSVVEDPFATFLVYDGFRGAAGGTLLDNAKWFVQAPAGDAPLADNGILVTDNVVVTLRAPLSAPMSVTFLARINGVTCDEVFFGFTGDETTLFELPPSAGFFVHTDLAAVLRIAPSADDTPTPVGESFVVDTLEHRYTVTVDGVSVRAQIDGAVVAEDLDLNPGFAPQRPLYATVQVGGACSVAVRAIWATPLPLPAPAIAAEEPVVLKLFE